MANEKNLFWYYLIKYLKSKGQITNGLTIPYIIGAKKMLDESYVVDENSIEALLNEIVESSISEVSAYQLCMEIREYVIGLENPNDPSLRHEVFLSGLCRREKTVSHRGSRGLRQHGAGNQSEIK